MFFCVSGIDQTVAVSDISDNGEMWKVLTPFISLYRNDLRDIMGA